MNDIPDDAVITLTPKGAISSMRNKGYLGVVGVLERQEAEIQRLREAGSAALSDMEGGNDASAHLILKNNFGPKP